MLLFCSSGDLEFRLLSKDTMIQNWLSAVFIFIFFHCYNWSEKEKIYSIDFTDITVNPKHNVMKRKF